MSVKKEANGRRSVQVEFEVPGTPDEVWQALATGPGISSWFVPTEVDERDGKPVAVKYNFGPGIQIRSVVTAWDPPRTFGQAGDGMTPGSPQMASEWSIEARGGGICTVRVVHSLFASTEAEAWETLTAALGVKGVSVGQRWTTPAGVSPLSGVVELVTENPYDALLRLDKPGPGIAALGAVTYPSGDRVVAMNLYMYGDQAPATVARETPRWQAWLQERFPMPTESGKSQ